MERQPQFYQSFDCTEWSCVVNMSNVSDSFFFEETYSGCFQTFLTDVIELYLLHIGRVPSGSAYLFYQM
jgi:hypothetical protein